MRQTAPLGPVSRMYAAVLPTIIEGMKREAADPALWTGQHDELLAIMFRKNMPGCEEIAQIRARTVQQTGNSSTVSGQKSVLYSKSDGSSLKLHHFATGDRITYTAPRKPKKAKG